MIRPHALRLPTAALLAAAVATPAAQADTEIEALRAQMQAMQAELNTLKQGSLNAARTEAMADAEQRVNFADAPLVSGHNGKNFVITDPAGDFNLAVYGQLQFRYVFNTADGDGNDADGAELRRTKVGFKGSIGKDEKFGFKSVLAYGNGDGVADIEDFEISYKLNDSLKGTIGQKKLPFARQELISSSKQLGAERSFATEFFTLDRSQGAWLDYKVDGKTGVALAITDGADNGVGGNGFSSTGSDESDLALTARVDYAAIGKGKASTDLVAWQGDDETLLLGAAGHLNFAQEVNDYYAVTADALYKKDGFSALGAVYGLFTDDDDDSFDYGVALEAGYNVDDKWQPFGRVDFVDLDGAAGGDTFAIGGGVNYFIDKHNTKFTADVTYIDEAVSSSGRTPNSPGTSLGELSGDEQVIFRAQFQILF